MRTLMLMRHGAAASPPGATDRERPLTNRGRGRSLRVGDALRTWLGHPERVVLSPAVRVQETWEAYALGLQVPGSIDDLDHMVETDNRIYENTTDDLLDVLRETIDDVEHVLLIGHNPSVAGLASVLDEDEGNTTREDLVDGLPTSGMAVFDVDSAWSELREGDAVLRKVLVGRR